jgi:hypothetical protein
MNFDWGDHRKARWVRLCAAILGDECRTRALTALLNLDSRHSTDERTISDSDLKAGWTHHIRPLLAEVQPRIVCALTNRVWDTIVPNIGVRVRTVKCPFELAREPLAFKTPGCTFETVLVKPHNHPSRFLSNQQIDLLGSACQWLIVDRRGRNQRG